MALIDSFESSGNWLFKRRGQIPVILFLFAIPAVYFTDYSALSETVKSAYIALAIAAAVAGFIVRAYTIGTTPKGTSGRNTTGQVAEQLNSSGIYSTVRHPLYLGNYLMWIGIVLFTMNFSFTIIVSLLYWLYYERIMFAEERFLAGKFGPSYREWSNRVPAFIPSFSKFKKGSVPFSVVSVLRREYSGVLATVIGFVYVQILINYKTCMCFSLQKTAVTVLAVTVLITLVLRSLKHYTSLLNESERS